MSSVPITPELIADFRTTYPQFLDVIEYPDGIVAQALCEGDAETMGCGWGAYADDCANPKRRGMFAYAAHWLVTFYPNGATDPSNPSIGVGGAVTSKSVGDESIGYQVAPSSFIGDDFFRTSVYGQMFLRMSKMCCISFYGGA